MVTASSAQGLSCISFFFFLRALPSFPVSFQHIIHQEATNTRNIAEKQTMSSKNGLTSNLWFAIF